MKDYGYNDVTNNESIHGEVAIITADIIRLAPTVGKQLSKEVFYLLIHLNSS